MVGGVGGDDGEAEAALAGVAAGVGFWWVGGDSVGDEHQDVLGVVVGVGDGEADGWVAVADAVEVISLVASRMRSAASVRPLSPGSWWPVARKWVRRSRRAAGRSLTCSS